MPTIHGLSLLVVSLSLIVTYRWAVTRLSEFDNSTCYRKSASRLSTTRQTRVFRESRLTIVIRPPPDASVDVKTDTTGIILADGPVSVGNILSVG